MSNLVLDFSQPAIARSTDPQHSHDAAETVDSNRNRRLLLDFMRTLNLSYTDEEIRLWYRAKNYPWQSDSGLRTRRRELVDRGLVVEDGEGVTASGRRCAKWKAV